MHGNAASRAAAAGQSQPIPSVVDIENATLTTLQVSRDHHSTYESATSPPMAPSRPIECFFTLQEEARQKVGGVAPQSEVAPRLSEKQPLPLTLRPGRPGLSSDHGCSGHPDPSVPSARWQLGPL